jgi:beta-glucosidase
VSSCPVLTLAAALLLLGSATASPPAAAPAVSVHPELWPAAAPAATDQATEVFVEQLLAHMSLEEKVGQMIQADIASISPAEAQRRAGTCAPRRKRGWIWPTTFIVPR